MYMKIDFISLLQITIDFFQGGQSDAKDFLLFYYYGGMIYTALKNYERALYLYEVVSVSFLFSLDKYLRPNYFWAKNRKAISP